jgi:hypothetical protein
MTGRNAEYEITAILDVLDDGEEDLDVALPQEDALQTAEVALGLEVGEVARVVGQRDDGHVQPRVRRPLREFQRRHVAERQAGDDEVVAALLGGECERLDAGRDAGQLRRVA